MQFHLNGFRTGDPGKANQTDADRPLPDRELPAETDVLIVGCGPAGLTLAAQLAQFADIKTVIIDQKPGPLRVGQADGIACRTMEMFEAFGFVDRVLREAYWVNETTFWKPDPADRTRIARTGRVQDTEDGLSEFPHVILNQARVHEFYLDVMRDGPAALSPHYNRRFVSVEIDPNAGPLDHAAHVTLDRLAADGTVVATETIKARYVVGCDGARSQVRRSLGLELKGDSANQAWGVMDVLAVTDFPDIRFKALMQSAREGSMVLIPREGGYLARFYIELDKLAAGERVSAKQLASSDLIAAANRILSPYVLDVKEVAWWSVYEIGQRLCDRFDDVPDDQRDRRIPRVFIAGDACHTHSPKAGQGMNVSMQDAFNLGWKLASVLRGQSQPALLNSYSTERQAIAAELIAFDREWAALLSQPARDPNDPNSTGVDPAETQRYFVRSGRYTAGTATRYAPSALTGTTKYQGLATGLAIGTRFHSAPVVRVADAKPMQLGHVGKADGRWRIYLFSDKSRPDDPSSAIARICDLLVTSNSSPLLRYRPEGADIDSAIDVRAVFQHQDEELDLEQMPTLLLPAKGRLGLRDYEKMFYAAGSGKDIFEMRGIDRASGCAVIVRPDQYVANILPLGGFDAITDFFVGAFGK